MEYQKTEAEKRDMRLWDQAHALARDAERFFDRTGGMGTIELFYRPTDEKFDGIVTVVPEHIHAPLGYLSAGVSIRAVLTRDQVAKLYHDAMRHLPILPREVRQ